MKTSLTYLKHHLVCFGAAVLLLVSVSAAKAQILLSVNISDPSDVIITATGVAPLASATDILYNGVELSAFFTGTTHNQTLGVVGASTLAPGSGSAGGDVYNGAAGDNLSSSDEDLALFNLNLPSSSEIFASAADNPLGLAAFSGTISLDLSGYSLPTAGATGNIVTGFNGSPNGHTVIGTYQVVETAAPEPSSWILILLSFLLLGFFRVARVKRSGD
jgi:hypothetical protein